MISLGTSPLMLPCPLAVAGLLLTSCTVGPDYKKPCKPLFEEWKIDDDSVSEQPFENVKCREVFQDDILTQLIHEGYAGNFSLQITGVKVLQARAQMAQFVGELYPQQQDIIGNRTDYRIGVSQFQSLLPTYFATGLDFWGKYRRAIQPKNATFLASIAAYHNALVTLTSDIASVYIKIRTTEEQIKLTKANIQAQLTGLKIAETRHSEDDAIGSEYLFRWIKKNKIIALISYSNRRPYVYYIF